MDGWMKTYPDNGLILATFKVLLGLLCIRCIDNALHRRLCSISFAVRHLCNFCRILLCRHWGTQWHHGCSSSSWSMMICTTAATALKLLEDILILLTEFSHLIGLDDLGIDAHFIQSLVVRFAWIDLFDLGKVPGRSQGTHPILFFFVLNAISVWLLR